MSPSEVHAAARRTLVARLSIKQDDRFRPQLRNIEEFLNHGIQYVFVPERGQINRDMPTTYACSPPLNNFIVERSEPPLIWPDPQDKVRGESFSPLYQTALLAVRNDPVLYELLTLIDAIRDVDVIVSQ